jgi:hypothetical protein
MKTSTLSLPKAIVTSFFRKKILASDKNVNSSSIPKERLVSQREKKANKTGLTRMICLR